MITYNAAISACEKGPRPHLALHMLQQLQVRGFRPDVITYSAAISVCEKGQILWQAMLHQGLLPDVIPYSAAISACEKGHKP